MKVERLPRKEGASREVKAYGDERGPQLMRAGRRFCSKGATNLLCEPEEKWSANVIEG